MNLNIVIKSDAPLTASQLDLLIIRATGIVRSDIAAHTTRKLSSFVHAKTPCNVEFELEGEETQ